MNERKTVLQTILIATIAFALALGAALCFAAAAENSRPARIEKALERGDVARAAALSEKLRDEELRNAYMLRCRRAAADEALAAENWDEAAALFAALGDYDGAAEGYAAARYGAASAALEAGVYDRAAELFDALGTYADAAEKARRARYENAVALAEAGRTAESFLLLYKLGDYADALERALSLAETLCGSRDLEAGYAAAHYLSPEEVSRRAALAEKREALPRGIVAVGFYHTAALKNDGTVLACGDDSFGQCQVSAWHSVKQICAGAYHTVGLLEDGTVIAAGRNDEGQCDVGDWRDIVAVTAADWATFGLKRDGTVVACGFNDYYMLDDWTKITAISGGSYALAALREGGDALLSHESARSEELHELVDIAVNTGYAVGLRADGSAVCAAAELSDWTDIIAAAASANAVLGLDAQGRVHAAFFRAGEEYDVSALRDIRAMAAGGTHYAFVTESGDVITLGENEHGECETGAWKLF